MIRKLLCFFGFHDYCPRKLYQSFDIEIRECKHCGYWPDWR